MRINPKLFIIVPLTLIIIILYLSDIENTYDYEDYVIKRIAEQFCASVYQEDVPNAIIAIYPFKGDKNEKILRVIEQEVAKKKPFTLVERVNLTEAEKERLNNLSPDIDPNSIIDLAAKLGTDGIVLGQISMWSSKPGKVKISANFRLIDLQTLAIMWADRCEEEKVSWFNRFFYIIIFALIILILLLFVDLKPAVKKKEIVTPKKSNSLTFIISGIAIILLITYKTFQARKPYVKELIKTLYHSQSIAAMKQSYSNIINLLKEKKLHHSAVHLQNAEAELTVASENGFPYPSISPVEREMREINRRADVGVRWSIPGVENLLLVKTYQKFT